MTNFVKKLFLVALFNYILIGAIVLAFNRPNNSGTPIIPVVVPTISEVVSKPKRIFAKPTTNNRCIIVIDGLQYDITDFRNLHSGGNVFTCGTDMSSVFHNRHSNSFLSWMKQYQI